jgi:type IV secretory pathway VirB4 component
MPLKNNNMAKPSHAASQKFVPVRDISSGVVVLKNGQMNMVLLATSINFALKSTDEQTAILRQFQSFLNTIDFSLQIYVQSRRLDIKPYLEQLAERESEQYNDLMRIQLREYMNFVETFVTEVDIMRKNFFVVVPYTPINTDIKSNLSSMIGGKSPTVTIDPNSFAEHRTQLEQRVSVVEQGLNRLGVRTVALDDEALVELYYHIFNPGDIAGEAPQ